MKLVLILFTLILSFESFSMTHYQREQLLKKQRQLEILRNHYNEKRKNAKKGISRLGKVVKKEDSLKVFFKYCGYVSLDEKLIKDHQIEEGQIKTFFVSASDRCKIVDVKI